MNSAARKKKPSVITVTFETTVDPDWIEWVTQTSDVFSRHDCGYWAYGARHCAKKGWLVYEHGDDANSMKSEEKEEKVVAGAWRRGEPLPKRWFRFDEDLARRAWVEGVRLYGEKWYEDADSSRRDYVLQIALFGDKNSKGEKDARYG